MPENLRAILRARRRGFPPPLHTGVEHFVRGRLVIPDGDRRQSTESRDVVNEPYPTRMTQDDVMRVFILDDDILHHLHRL